MVVALLMLFIFMILFGTPIFIALAFSSLLVFTFYTDVPLTVIAQRMFAGIDKFSLLSIAFFIFGANVMKTGGIAERILKLAFAVVGHLRGGIAFSTQLASMFFGAVSGSSPATVVAIGGIMYPSLKQQKYGNHFSAGLIAASGSVALLIPPSISAIVYSSVTGVSVGALFMAGFGAGILYGLIYLIYIYLYCRRKNIPVEKRRSLLEILKAAKEASWALGVPIIIIGGIYGGVFTPTESSAVAAVYGVLVALFIYKGLDWRGLYKIAIESVVSTSQIMMLLAGASVFGYIMTQGQVPQSIASSIGTDISPFMFLLILNIILLISGMFIDGSSAIIIMAPLLYPIAINLGIDPVHLGLIMVANAAIGMFTPPFGLNLFVAKSELKIPLLQITRGVMPFVVISILALAIITYIPQISLWLPKAVYGP